MVTAVQAPEKELRFTRSGQAVGFWIAAAMCGGVAVSLAFGSLYREIDPSLPHPAWALIPAVAMAMLVRLSIRLTRHAYVILTPLGVEIFPFFRPARGMRLVTWQEIDSAEFSADGRWLTLHHDAEKTSGIHLSLRPLRADRRTLLAKALLGRLSPARDGS